MALSIDAHLDVPWIMHKYGHFNLRYGTRQSQFDLIKAKDGGLQSAFFALYLHENVINSNGLQAAKSAIREQITRISNQTGSVVVNNLATAQEVINNGVFPIFLGLEGGKVLGNDLTFLEELYGYGLRYLTLTHNYNNSWADSATDIAEHKGLKADGVRFLRHCEQLGIYVDVSHASELTALRAITLSCRPVVATHSGARNVTDHVRNLSDDVIGEIVESNGVIGVPFVQKFTEGKVFEHIDYIVQRWGVENVGIGSDLDGAALVAEVKDVSDWDFFVADLESHGYPTDAISKIKGGNWSRLLG